MSLGQMPQSELAKFGKRPKVCGYCGAPESEYNPLVIHHCFFRSHKDNEATEKEWNWDWACVKHHTDGAMAAHNNFEVAEHFRQRALARKNGTLKTNPLI